MQLSVITTVLAGLAAVILVVYLIVVKYGAVAQPPADQRPARTTAGRQRRPPGTQQTQKGPR